VSDRARAWVAGLAVAGAYSALGIVPYWSYWSAGGAMVAGKGGDPATDAWFLAWVPYALAHGHNPLVTDWGNYPGGVNAIASIGMPLLGVAGAPVTWVAGAFVTTTLLFTLAFPLSAIAGYAFAREWVSWRPAAFAAGLLYGFSPYLMAHGGSHLNLVFVPLPPLIFLALTRIVRGAPWLRWGVLLGALCVAQFLISAEVLASTVITGAIGLAVATAVCWPAARQRWPHTARAIASALAVAVVCLAYPLWLMLAGPGHLRRPVQDTSLYRGNLLAPVIPDSSMYFRTAGSARLANTLSGGTSENGLYLGPPLLVVLVVGAVLLWRRPAMKVVALATAAEFVLSLGSRLTIGHYLLRAVPLPAAIFYYIPVLDNTIAARYSLYVMLGGALMFALILEAARAGAAWRCATLAVVVLLPLLPAWPFWLHVTQPPPYFASAVAQDRIQAGSVAVSYPFPSDDDAYPMLWQVAAGLRYKSPGGRFVIPSGEPLFARILIDLSEGTAPAPTPALRAALTAQLQAWHVRTVLVQVSGVRPALVLPFFDWLLARPPDTTTGGIAAWYGTTS